MKTWPNAIGIETELFPGFISTTQNSRPADEEFYKQFWLAFLESCRGNVVCAPGTNFDGMHAPSDDWEQRPTILFASCGGKIYLDARNHNFSSAYPEWCTPECASPFEAAAYANALDGVFTRAFRLATQRVATPQKVETFLYRISNMGNNPYGMHENYAISIKLYERLRSEPDSYVRRFFLPFMASRYLVAGSGSLEGNKFVLSTRALRTQKYVHSVVVGSPITGERGVIDGRLEHHAVDSRRLHVVCGDVTSGLTTNALRFGSLWLVLRYLEYLCARNLQPEMLYSKGDPWELFQYSANWLDNPTSTNTPLRVQALAVSAIEAAKHKLNLTPEEATILKIWRQTLSQLQRDFRQCTQLEWVQKFLLAEQASKLLQAPEDIQEILLGKHQLFPEAPDRLGRMENEPDFVKHCREFHIEASPDKAANTPRAQLRSQLITSKQRATEYRFGWSCVHVCSSQGQQKCLLFPSLEDSAAIELHDYLGSAVKKRDAGQLAFACDRVFELRSLSSEDNVLQIMTELLHSIQALCPYLSERGKQLFAFKLNTLGLWFEESNKDDQAKECFTKANSIRSTTVSKYNMLGIAHKQNDKATIAKLLKSAEFRNFGQQKQPLLNKNGFATGEELSSPKFAEIIPDDLIDLRQLTKARLHRALQLLPLLLLCVLVVAIWRSVRSSRPVASQDQQSSEGDRTRIPDGTSSTMEEDAPNQIDTPQADVAEVEPPQNRTNVAPKSHFEEANERYSSGEHDEALKALGKYLEQELTAEEKSQGLALKGAVYCELNMFADADIEFEKSLAIAENAAAYQGRGMIAFSKGQFAAAITDFDMAIKTNQKSQTEPSANEPSKEFRNFCLEDVYLYRGASHLSLGDAKNAVRDFEKSIEARPTQLIAYQWLCSARFSLKDYRGAVAASDEAIRLMRSPGEKLLGEAKLFELQSPAKKRRTVTRMIRGTSKGELMDYVSALNDFDELIVEDSANLLAYQRRGYVRYILNDYKGAVKDLDYVLENWEQFEGQYADQGTKEVKALVYNYRGAAHAKRQELREAIADFSESIKLESDFAMAYQNRGISKLLMKDYRGGIRDIERSVSLGLEDPSSHVYLAIAKRQLSDPNGARRELETARELMNAYRVKY